MIACDDCDDCGKPISDGIPCWCGVYLCDTCNRDHVAIDSAKRAAEPDELQGKECGVP